jgi:hypothetical protein
METQLRGIRLNQINSLAALVTNITQAFSLPIDKFDKRRISEVTWDNITMYYINTHVVKPLTKEFRCSFVELVATRPQAPRWFVSHFWGTPFKETVEMLNYHAKKRNLPDTIIYWVCTFANNQHNLAELKGSLEETPFVKAILSSQCEGTVALFDGEASTLQRSWCVLENFVSTSTAWAKKEKTYLYDIAAWLPAGIWTRGGDPNPAVPILRLDHGDRYFIEGDWGFPPAIDRKGVEINICTAEASRKEDKRNILHMIAGTPTERWNTELPKCNQKYDEVNYHARRLFIPGVLHLAARNHNSEELKRLLMEFPEDHNSCDSQGTSLVGIAAEIGDVNSLSVLLNAKADLGAADRFGETPIHKAARTGNVHCLRVLLETRADPSVVTNHGETPIMVATGALQTETLRMLQDAGAK